MPENERVLASIENVAYSDFVKMEENENVLRTHARNTFVHAQNNAGFAFHPVAAVRSSFCENVLETAAKPLLLNASTFEAYGNMLLTHDSCMFLIFYDSEQKPLSLKM